MAVLKTGYHPLIGQHIDLSRIVEPHGAAKDAGKRDQFRVLGQVRSNFLRIRQESLGSPCGCFLRIKVGHRFDDLIIFGDPFFQIRNFFAVADLLDGRLSVLCA